MTTTIPPANRRVILTAFHGTNQTFDAFDGKLLGLANPNSASLMGVFFAGRADTAWDYAQKAARSLVPDHIAYEERVQDLLDRAARASARGNHDLSEKLYLDAEVLETTVMQAEPANGRVLECEITLNNPVSIDGTSRHVVTDLGRVLQMARDAGHDSVILTGICDTPSGQGAPDDHIVVFDPAQIHIRAVLLEPEPDMDVEFAV
jgi:hypothetical protein